MQFIKRAVLAAAVAAALAANAAAQPLQQPITTAMLAGERAPLVAAFRAAREYDPQFRGAIAERNVNDSVALQSRLAYAPEFRSSYTQVETEGSPRATFALVQPLLSAERYFMRQEAAPRTRFAQLTLEQREQDLALRLLKTVTDLVRAREGLLVNDYRIKLLEEQAKRAVRLFQLQEGTITDQRDTAVRLAQARAQDLSLLTRVRVAENQFNAIVGAKPPTTTFKIVDTPRPIALDGLERYLSVAQDTNPQVAALRQSEQIAELGARRARSAFLPTISGIIQQSQSSGNSSTYLGATVSYPLQGQTYAQMLGAGAQAERAREQRREAEQRMRVDIERLRDLVDSGLKELVIRKDAIAAAELAVEANLKSQQGGIRTSVDVLNAIQTLADVRNDYATTAATLAESYLSLLLQSAVDPARALEQVQSALFER